MIAPVGCPLPFSFVTTTTDPVPLHPRSQHVVLDGCHPYSRRRHRHKGGNAGPLQCSDGHASRWVLPAPWVGRVD